MNTSHDNKDAQTPMRVRFVILHHHQLDGEQNDHQFKEHWDFMIEQAETLATWQLFENPTQNPNSEIQAKRIADHRKAYLEYEGPVSQNRGQVQQIESGTCVVKKSAPTNWIIELKGKKLVGQYELRDTNDNQWTWRPRTEK